MTKKVKERIEFHYFLTKIQSSTLILLEMKIFLTKCLTKIKDKSITRRKFRMQSDDSIMCGFYCIVFIE